MPTLRALDVGREQSRPARARKAGQAARVRVGADTNWAAVAGGRNHSVRARDAGGKIRTRAGGSVAALTLTVIGALLTACAAAGGPPTAAGHSGGERAFRVAVISDLNSAYGSTTYGAEVTAAVALIVERWRPDLVLAAGDLVAGQRPGLSDANVRAMWAAFDDVVAAPLRHAGIPFGFALGNHDASAYPAHARDRDLAIAHWRAPGRHPGVTFVDSAHYPLYYSFRQGPLFVVAWDATWAGTHSDTTMQRWLDDQLASGASASAAFRIVLGHLPLYAVAAGRDRPGEVLAEADSLRVQLERLGVHSYISGHHHAYYPGRRGGLELLHTGALGDGPRPLLGSAVPSPRTVTLLDFDARTGGVEYTTWALDGPASPTPVRLERLPLRLDGHNGYVVRRDLEDGGG